MYTKSMIAVVHYKLEQGAVELREVPYPSALEGDEVLLQTQGVGVCGSDVHQYHNTQSWRVNVPVILGHEFGGIVARIPKGLSGFKEGDRVVCETAARICGHCIYCRSGAYNLCPERLGFGYGVDGAMAEFVKVPGRCLHHLPASVAFEKAALTEPCCVAYNATCVQTRIRPGDAVVIIGPGPIGLLCLALAKLAGAGWIAVVGLKKDRDRLALAMSLGAHLTLDGSQEENMEIVRSIGDGIGVDAVIDAAGHSSTLQFALAAVRPAGQVTKVGWGPQPLNFSVDPLVQKAVRLQGSFSHNFPIWEKVISLLASGKLDPSTLIGSTMPLSQWRACFDEMASGQAVKNVLMPAQA